MRRNVLILHPLLPRPDQCSGDYQLWQLVTLLRRAGHGVTLLAFEQLAERADRERYLGLLAGLGCEASELLPRAAAASPWSWDLAQEKIRAVLDRNVFDAALVNFWNLAHHAVPILRRAAPRTRVIVHSWDVWHLREARGAALGGQLRLLRQVATQRHLELGAYAGADAVLAVTDADRDVLAAGLAADGAGGALPATPPVITVTHAHPLTAAPPPYAERRDVLFVGYFVHPPNVDAALWLAREVWPRAARRLPGVRLKIVGAQPPPELQALASPGVEILGYVPELEPLLDRCRVTIAPLRYGAGLKGKVTQALAAGLPVVTTPCGAEGIPIADGTHALVRADADGLARALVAAYEDEALWSRLSANGQALIAARHGDVPVAAPFFGALFGAAGELPALGADGGGEAPVLPDGVAALLRLLDGLEWQHTRRTPGLARSCFLEAERLDPRLAAAPLALADLEIAAGDPARAGEALRRARAAAPEAPGLLPVQAALWAALGRRDQALAAAERSLAIDPRDPGSLALKGELLRAQGDLKGSLRHLLAAKQAHPDDLGVHAALTRSLQDAGQGAQALNFWAQAAVTAGQSGQDREEHEARTQLRRIVAAIAGPGIDAAEVEPPAAADTAREAGRPPVSVVLLTHNALSYTQLCVASLLAHTPPECELILVDNGSEDGTVGFLRETAAARPGCRLILNPRNLGFAAGNNQGLAAARGDWIVLVNSDVVVTAGWLDRLLACARAHPAAGLVGPLTNRISGEQQVEVPYDQESLAGLDGFAAEFARERRGRARRHWRAVGFCLLVSREVVARIGGLDPRFGRGNFEDDDYCLRAHLAGFETWLAEDCLVHHFGGRSFAAAGVDYDASLLGNWEIFRAKWGLPADAAYGQAHDFAPYLRDGFRRERHHVPLPSPAQAAQDSPATPAPGEDPEPVREAIAAGERLFAAGRLAEAETCFRAVLEFDPSHARARNDLACALWRAGDAGEASRQLETLLAAEPDHRDAVWNLGQILRDLGDAGRARALYADFHARHPAEREFAEAAVSLT